MAAPGGREQRFACHAHQSWSPSWVMASSSSSSSSQRPHRLSQSSPQVDSRQPVAQQAGRPPGFQQIQTATALNLLPQSSSSPRPPCMPMHVAVRISPSAPPSPSVGRRRRKPAHSRRRVTLGTDLQVNPEQRAQSSGAAVA